MKEQRITTKTDDKLINKDRRKKKTNRKNTPSFVHTFTRINEKQLPPHPGKRANENNVGLGVAQVIYNVLWELFLDGKCVLTSVL